MLFKASQSRTADFVKVLAFNTDAAGSVTQYTPICFNVTGNSVDNLSGGHPIAANLAVPAGIAEATIPINGYDAVVAWGYVASILISNEGSSVTITAGDKLTLVVGDGVGVSSVGGETVTKANMGWLTTPDTGTYSAASYNDNILVRLLN